MRHVKGRNSGIGKKIAKLIREGKTKEQAAGEAYGMSREGRLTKEGGYIRKGRKGRRRR